MHIGFDVILKSVIGRFLVGLVLTEHLLKVLLFLSSLLLLKSTLHLHFLLQSINLFNISPESFFVVIALSGFFLMELTVTALFLLLDLLTLSIEFFLLSLTKELDVLILKFLILTALEQFIILSQLLFVHLLVKLSANQAASLPLSHHCLLLLFVVQKRVELLNCSPLVFFCKLRVDLSTTIGLAGC